MGKRELGPSRSCPARLLNLLSRRTPAYTTPSGAAYHGDCAQLLAELPDESVQLVLTSPPFALRRQKSYGNPPAAEYIAWFMPIAAQVRRVLRPDGSFVMELGGAWNPGLPTRSLMPYQLAVELGSLFHLAQEGIWNNPRALPAPAEWVCLHRQRLKPAATHLWWWAKTPYPWCNQRAVLTPYARPVNGINGGTRPSRHTMNGHTWQRDNGGAIPPNVFTVAGVNGCDPYAHRCRAEGVTIHPARMPPELPEFFIRFLTRPGQIVLDPFGGSNTTGHVAEQLGRRWLSIEINAHYVAGSRLRFEEPSPGAGD